MITIYSLIICILLLWYVDTSQRKAGTGGHAARRNLLLQAACSLRSTRERKNWPHSAAANKHFAARVLASA